MTKRLINHIMSLSYLPLEAFDPMKNHCLSVKNYPFFAYLSLGKRENLPAVFICAKVCVSNGNDTETMLHVFIEPGLVYLLDLK